MPESGIRRPPPATVEDWDDDAQTTLPGSGTTARISAKHRSQHDSTAGFREHRMRSDGADSGYVSRADTSKSESSGSGRRKMPELKVDTTGIRERERQPYFMAQATSSKPPTRRQSSSQSKDLPPEPRTPRTQPVVHAQGTCQICDQHGRHIDIKKEILRPASAAPPPSPMSTRQSAPKVAKDDNSLYNKTKQAPRSRQSRPLSMVQPTTIPLPYINQASYGPPMITTPGWATPTMAFNPVSYAYTPASPMMGPSYTPYSQMPLYYEPSIEPEPLSARPSRRSSPIRRSGSYGDPVIRQGYPEPGTAVLERVSSKENRPPLESRRSSRVFDDDRRAMPPPPKPPTQSQPHDVVVVRRPSTRRSKTYHPQDMPLREELYESDRYYEENIDFRDARGPSSANRGRRESPSRPPTSYRGPSVTGTRDRPSLPGKSVSYSTPT